MLETRGRINDHCVLSPVECIQLNLKEPAAEATAQTKAMRTLSFLHGQPVLRPFDLGAERDVVQWEVGPPRKWRVDIVVDPALGERTTPKPTILEVKRLGRASLDDVRNQLNRYITNARDLGITFEKNAELKQISWAQRYAFRGAEWCVWADRTSGEQYDGIVWFAPAEEAPDTCPKPPQLLPMRVTEEEWQQEAATRAREDGEWAQAEVDREFAKITKQLEEEVDRVPVPPACGASVLAAAGLGGQELASEEDPGGGLSGTASHDPLKPQVGLQTPVEPPEVARTAGHYAFPLKSAVGTTDGTPSAGFGDPVCAAGTVYHGSAFIPAPSPDDPGASRAFGEQASECTAYGSSDNNPLDAECSYALGVVNPNKLYYGRDEAPLETCHFETKESAERTGGDIAFATIADATDIPHHSVEAGFRILVAAGRLPWTDDGGDPMGMGRTVMCFYSNGFAGGEGDTADADYLYGEKNAAATWTIPQPFVVLDNG